MQARWNHGWKGDSLFSMNCEIQVSGAIVDDNGRGGMGWNRVENGPF